MLGVWGTVVYKIIEALNPDVPAYEMTGLSANADYKIETQVDTFSIRKVDRDPFLGTIVKDKKPVKKVASRPTLQWLPVEYQGMLSNGKKNKIFLISINGQQHLLKIGQERDSIKVLSGNNKQIRLQYRYESKRFLKLEQ